MKIDDSSNLPAISAPGAKAAAGVKSGSREPASAGVAGSPDTAELSGLAGKISNAISQDSEGRTATVEQLRAQVANGTYHADAAATAKGIVSESLANAAAAGGPAKK